MDKDEGYAILDCATCSGGATAGKLPAGEAAETIESLPPITFGAPVAGVEAGVTGKLAGTARGRATAESVVTAGFRALCVVEKLVEGTEDAEAAAAAAAAECCCRLASRSGRLLARLMSNACASDELLAGNGAAAALVIGK